MTCEQRWTTTSCKIHASGCGSAASTTCQILKISKKKYHLTKLLLGSELKKLKECFIALDADGSGAIGVEELVDPLIGLGFADNIYQVEDMV